MNRLNTLMLVVVATLMLAASACKKETETVQPDSSTPAFVGKNLMMTSFRVSPSVDLDGDGKVDDDLLSFLKPCERDNTILFEKNGKMSGGNGTLSCNGAEIDPSAAKPGTWTYNEQTKTIRIVKDNNPADVAEWKVVEASADGLKVEVSVNETTRSYKTTMTWKSI